MDGIHDMGGMDGLGEVSYNPRNPRFHSTWEERVFGIQILLVLQGVLTVDEARHAGERMPPASYLTVPYFERWLYSLEWLLLERGILTKVEYESKKNSLGRGKSYHEGLPQRQDPDLTKGVRDSLLSNSPPMSRTEDQRFSVGDEVVVRNTRTLGHTRIPGYTRRAQGVVRKIHRPFSLPDLAVHGEDFVEPVYTVSFDSEELWGSGAPEHHKVHVDLWESYLTTPGKKERRENNGSAMTVEKARTSPLRAETRPGPNTSDNDFEQPEIRTRSLEALLIERELISSDALDAVIKAYQETIGPDRGSEIVARAWTDAGFKTELLDRPNEVILSEFGYSSHGGTMTEVLENRPGVHNVLVCTLCSCFSWNLLGLPPDWYKSHAYRAALVKQPRRVLKESFGVELDDSVELRVRDLSGEIRPMVLPQTPSDTSGYTSAEETVPIQLEQMIGVAL